VWYSSGKLRVRRCCDVRQRALRALLVLTLSIMSSWMSFGKESMLCNAGRGRKSRSRDGHDEIAH